MTLAKMFEQIKHCRYIRHYRPNGSHQEDEDEDEIEAKDERHNFTLQSTTLPLKSPSTQ